MLQIAPLLESATVLQALIHQLGNNFKEIKSEVPCAFEKIQASHVVFGRACGTALTTPHIFRKATAFDIAIMLPEQLSASTANRTDSLTSLNQTNL